MKWWAKEAFFSTLDAVIQIKERQEVEVLLPSPTIINQLSQDPPDPAPDSEASS